VKPASLVARLTLLQQLLAGALILVFSGSAIWLSARTLERQETTLLANAAAHMAGSLEREWNEDSDLGRAARAALEESAVPGAEISVLDEAGRRVASTAAGAPRAPRPGTREQRVHLARGAWIVASISTRPRRDAVAALSLALLLAALPLFIAVVAGSRAVAGRALRPLSRMAAQAEQAQARGVVGPLGRPTDPAEVAALAQSFNRLLARLDDMLRAEQHFTQDAAHELRTPLTVLSGELEYALSDAALPARQREGLERAAEQARAMSELVEALLLLRRTDPTAAKDRTDLVPVNLSDLVREIARDLLDRAPGRAPDLAIAAEDEVLVAGHATLLASALRNLLSNALKFTDAGRPVRVTVLACRGRCQVVVEDGGPGIAPDERDRIFDPFYRGSEARARHEGFGLGLPILRRVARAHGGDVNVSASPLGGARFELSLPGWAARD
jgi:signal transduction histidine kinase